MLLKCCVGRNVWLLCYAKLLGNNSVLSNVTAFCVANKYLNLYLNLPLYLYKSTNALTPRLALESFFG